jgi:hypothetical protein
MVPKFLYEKLKGREDLGVNGRILLRRLLKK